MGGKKRHQTGIASLVKDANFKVTSDCMCKYNVGDFAKPVSNKGVPIHDLNINPAEMEMYVMDLEPTLYMATEEMSLTKV